MNDSDYLRDWARRAAADLREYADAAAEAGNFQAETESLIAELDDILAGRPTWQRRYAKEASGAGGIGFLDSE